jgi:hypothetical protein
MHSVYVVYEVVNIPTYPQIFPPPQFPHPDFQPPFPPMMQPFPTSPTFPSNPLQPIPYIPKQYSTQSIKIVCVCKSVTTASYYCSQAPNRYTVGPIQIVE